MDYQLILPLAKEFGLDLISALDIRNADFEVDVGLFKGWLAEGYEGELAYLRKDPKIFENLNSIFPGIKSVLAFAVRYESLPKIECPQGYGRVARYALGRDYHRVLSQRLKKFADALENRFNLKFSYRACSDAIPILERSLAKQAGLGFIGKNTMLISPEIGSFTLLAEILSDLEIQNIPVKQAIKAHCGACSRCISSCPTQAIVKPYTVDARLCISYLTIEKRGVLSADESKLIADWLFGCDICQEVCPFNYRQIKKYKKTDADFISRASENGIIELAPLLNIANDLEFLKRFNGTPFMRAKRSGIIRNALILIANSRYLNLIDQVIFLVNEDSSNIIREQARQVLLDLSTIADGIDRVKILNCIKT